MFNEMDGNPFFIGNYEIFKSPHILRREERLSIRALFLKSVWSVCVEALCSPFQVVQAGLNNHQIPTLLLPYTQYDICIGNAQSRLYVSHCCYAHQCRVQTLSYRYIDRQLRRSDIVEQML